MDEKIKIEKKMKKDKKVKNKIKMEKIEMKMEENI